jgi:iron complex outermembrane receptor protein
VLGAEVELQARPLPGLSLEAGFGWLDTAFEKFTVTKAVNQRRGTPESVPFDYSGNPLISAPRYSVSAIVDYEIPLSGFGSLIPQYDFSWRSTAYFDPAALDPISQEPYWLHNARLAYRTPDGRIEVAGWVQNFLDEQYRADSFDLSLQYNTILEVWGDPRTYGLTVTYTW